MVRDLTQPEQQANLPAGPVIRVDDPKRIPTYDSRQIPSLGRPPSELTLQGSRFLHLQRLQPGLGFENGSPLVRERQPMFGSSEPSSENGNASLASAITLANECLDWR